MAKARIAAPKKLSSNREQGRISITDQTSGQLLDMILFICIFHFVRSLLVAVVVLQ